MNATINIMGRFRSFVLPLVASILACGCSAHSGANASGSGGTGGIPGAGGSAGTAAAGGAGGSSGSGGSLPCDPRFSFSVTPPVAALTPFTVSFTDTPGYTNVDMRVTGPGSPTSQWIGLKGKSPYTWSWSISGHGAGVLTLTFVKDIGNGSSGTPVASCQVQSQGAGTGGSGGSSGSLVPLQWTEVSAPTGANFEERFGASVGSCLFAWDRNGATHAAKELAPGQLGSWTVSQGTPYPHYDTWAVTVQNNLFVGTFTPGCFSCYYLATVDPTSCTISPWAKAGVPGGGYGGPWMGGALDGKGHVYALGGNYGDTTPKNSGFWGTISGGSIAWNTIDDMGGGLMSPSAVAVQDHLYLMGGGTDINVNNGPTTDEVRVASLAQDGTPSGFSAAGKLWPGRAMVVAVTSQYVYAIGGVDAPTGGFTHALRAARAPLTGSGIGAWQDVPSLVSSLPQGYGVGYLPYAQIGSVLYAFAGVDYPDVSNWVFQPDRVFAVLLE